MTTIKYNKNELNVDYSSQFYDERSADEMFQALQDLPFYFTTLTVFGNTYTPSRKVIAYADPGISYSFSGTTVYAEPWTPLMLKIREDVEKAVSCKFNYVLINSYPNGFAKIGHHKDNESALTTDHPIAVVSFGAQRTIEFKRPNCATTSIVLEHGSLYVMHPPTNNLFTHGIPVEPNVTDLRISLTFRHIEPASDQPPPSKKSKMEDDFINSNDWLDQIFQKPRDALVMSWDLSFGLFITLYCHDYGMRLHIREHVQNKSLDYLPTKRGVVMNGITWLELSHKLITLSFKYKNTSFIANNQLAVFQHDENYCVMQQIFNNDNLYSLKDTFVRMAPNDVEKVLKLADKITDCFIKHSFTKYLPELILKNKQPCKQLTHVDSLQAKQNLFKECFHALSESIHDSFFCQGCSEDNFSQHRHSCMTLSDREKFMTNTESAYIHMNMFIIAQCVKSKYCTCEYTTPFFKSLDFDEFKSYFETQFEIM